MPKKTQDHSPVIKKKEPAQLLSFPEAMQQVISGNRIHKIEWGDTQYFCELKDGRLKLHKPDGKYYDWLINDGDMLGTDFVVLK